MQKGATQQLQNARISSGTAKTATLSLVGQTLAAVTVPAGSSLDTKTMTFVNVVNGVDYPVRKPDNTVYSIVLAAGDCVVVDRYIAEALSEFKIVVNSNAASDADLILIGFQS